MDNITLPSATAVQDYLKSKGQDSSFGARKSIFNNSGLSERLGSYLGSTPQNISLLKILQKQDAAPTASVLENFKPTESITDVQNTATQSPKLSDNPYIPTFGRRPEPKISEAIKPPEETVRPPVAPNPNQTFDVNQATTLARALGANDTQIKGVTDAFKPSQNLDTTTKTNSGISASTLYPDIFKESNPSEADLVNQYLNSAEGQLFMDKQNLKSMTDDAKAEATKQELEAKYKAEKETLENNLAKNGLAFSGIRATKVKALADSLAASELGVDRELASKLLDADLNLREAILKGVSDLAKKAQEGRKEAIQQLNAVGYAVIGDRLVPTLSARSAERSDISLAISERRLQLAEESAARAEAKFNEQFGTGRKDQFKYVKELMDLNPNATRAELKSAALENTYLSATEIDSLLDNIGLAPGQAAETAKALVATTFRRTFGNLTSTDLAEAKSAAKQMIKAAGGIIKVGGRTIALTSQQIDELNQYIDTVTKEEADATKALLDKQK